MVYNISPWKNIVGNMEDHSAQMMKKKIATHGHRKQKFNLGQC